HRVHRSTCNSVMCLRSDRLDPYHRQLNRYCCTAKSPDGGNRDHSLQGTLPTRLVARVDHPARDTSLLFRLAPPGFGLSWPGRGKRLVLARPVIGVARGCMVDPVEPSVTAAVKPLASVQRAGGR